LPIPAQFLSEPGWRGATLPQANIPILGISDAAGVTQGYGV